MARKSISNKVRFEIFKRDKFTCQYCGRTIENNGYRNGGYFSSVLDLCQKIDMVGKI